MRARGGVTTRRVLAHPGWLSVVALAVLASVAVYSVLDAGLRVWSTNAGIGAGHVAVTGAPLPGSAIVTVPARPARQHPEPVQQVPPPATPLRVAPAPGAGVVGNGPAPAPISWPALPSAPTGPEVPVTPPALLTLVAPLAPSIRVAGVRPLALRALVLSRQAETETGAPVLRLAWTRPPLADLEDEQPAADTTTSSRSWGSGWTRYRQPVRAPAPTTSTRRWSAHTWHAWR